VICASYGPVTIGWDGRRLRVSPLACRKRVELYELAERVPVESADPRLLYLLGVPRGCVTTYRLYAETVGMAPRAAARLLLRNPFPVLLPCHRVVASDLSLGGYAAGAEVKRALLVYEGALRCGAPPVVVRPGAVSDIKGALLDSLGLSDSRAAHAGGLQGCRL